MSKKELLQDDEGDHMVFYFPPVKKDQMPERDRCAPCRLLRRPSAMAHFPVRRAMALVAKMGGKVAKKYEVDVINMVPPGTEGSGRPGLIVYDYTYLFDCHGEGAMLACRPCATVASAAHRAAAQG